MFCNCTWCVFLLLLCFYIVYSCNVSTVLCHITVLRTPVSARILALVLQLYERNKLKVKVKLDLASADAPANPHAAVAS